MPKRMIALLLVILALSGLTVSAVEAVNPAQTVRTVTDAMTQAATRLNKIGFLSGTGMKADGTPDFDLARTPTRAEVFTFLVRLTGGEAKALSESGTHPFTDVPTWADPYVAFAYANKLTSGTSATTFGASDPITAQQFATLLLRILGYEEGADFSYDTATSDVVSLGIITAPDIGVCKEVFTRGDMAIFADKMLIASPKGESFSCIDILAGVGAISASAANEAGYNVSGQTGHTTPDPVPIPQDKEGYTAGGFFFPSVSPVLQSDGTILNDPRVINTNRMYGCKNKQELIECLQYAVEYWNSDDWHKLISEYNDILARPDYVTKWERCGMKFTERNYIFNIALIPADRNSHKSRSSTGEAYACIDKNNKDGTSCGDRAKYVQIYLDIIGVENEFVTGYFGATPHAWLKVYYNNEWLHHATSLSGRFGPTPESIGLSLTKPSK